MMDRNTSGATGRHIAALLVILVILSSLYLLIAAGVHKRTGDAKESARSAANKIWGPNVIQESPGICVDGAPELAIPLSAAKGSVDINMDYRKRGLIYLSGFRAAFNMEYRFANNEPVARRMHFRLPLPQNVELFSDLKVEGADPATEQVIFVPDGISWYGNLSSGASKTLRISYSIRGIEDYIYRLPRSQVLEEFSLHAVVKPGEGIDYLPGTMAPTSAENSEDVSRFDWDFAGFISGTDVGLRLPEHPDYSKDIVRLNSFAPLLLLGLLLMFLLLLRGRYIDIDVVSLAFIGLSFFIIFPLAAYLATYISLNLAYIIAACAGAVTLLVYIGLKFGREALPVGFAGVALFFGVFPMALLADGYTGLLTTIGAFLLIVLMMIEHIAGRLTFGEGQIGPQGQVQ